MYAEDDFLSLSGLQHISFCERQWALIHLEQAWEENYDTVRGELFHQRAHTEGYTCRDGLRFERGVRVWSYELGLSGIADIVEYGPQQVVPVEYKVGRPKAEPWDRIQVAAQAMCLEEMASVKIPAAALFYGETRRRESVAIDGGLRESVVALSRRMHQLYATRSTPPALQTRHCSRCSLKDLCLPESFREEARNYWEENGEELDPLR